jgi:pyruvate-ferredoxin/flavodoxin oxidoreductase
LRRFVIDVLHPVNAQKGDALPVSTFADTADGTFPQGSSAFEKRGIAIDVPVWHPENCIQCNRCALVCPHAVNRPEVLTDEELAAAPEAVKSKAFTGMPGKSFCMAFSVMDCMGCAQCANVCPGMRGNKALTMAPLHTQLGQQAVFDYCEALPKKPEVLDKFKAGSVIGSQYRTPLLEFSGACAGCGETPYAKLVTQLYGERMYIANATGCSSIWGGSAPSTPYTVNKEGKGPAWPTACSMTTPSTPTASCWRTTRCASAWPP